MRQKEPAKWWSVNPVRYHTTRSRGLWLAIYDNLPRVAKEAGLTLDITELLLGIFFCHPELLRRSVCRRDFEQL